MLGLIERLVNTNSYSGDPDGITRVTDMLEQELSAIEGVSVQRIDDHLVASTASAKASAAGCVALVGHHDTVFPPGTFEGFTRDGDIARGPGVLDMKSGLVLCIEALRELAERGIDLPVRFVSVSDEEVGSPTGGAILKTHLRGAACALVFEAGRKADGIITARKGTGGLRAIVSGKAAHSGLHHADGANAIWALAKLIDVAQTFTDYDRGVTVNIGTISGGTSRNTVPANAEGLFDLRFLTIADGEALVKRFHEAAAAVDVPGTTIELVGGIKRPPLERTSANVALCEEYAACAKAAGLGHGECPLVGGGSDASTTAAMGIPSIDGLGPRGSGFHTSDELIEVSSLPLRREALVRFLVGRANLGTDDPQP
jgi:glutamate carboxypeptidase